jgi:hypothetical protein
MAIDGNEVAAQLTRQGSSHPLIGPEPALGILAKGAREVMRGWMNKKHEDYRESIFGQRQSKGFLKSSIAKKLETYSV